MPLTNRVLPTGEIVAIAARGDMLGNRGILHDDGRTLLTRRWQHHAWVTCKLSFKNRRRTLMTPNRYTELFFLDEAVALAAGHRPCGECRRTAYNRFKTLFCDTHGTQTIQEIDRAMQTERVQRNRTQVRHQAECGALPDGAFVLYDGAAHLVWENQILLYEPGGYTSVFNRPRGAVTVLTPACTVVVLRMGYKPRLHASAHALLEH